MDFVRLRQEVLSLRFVWVLCHAVVIVGTILSIIYLVIGDDPSFHYKNVCKAALVSFIIPVYKRHWPISFNQEYFAKILANENVQYILISVALLFAIPVPVSLAPLFGFSVFHFVGYLNDSLLPILSRPLHLQYRDKLKQLLDQRPFAMKFIAFFEIVILVSLVFGLFSGGSLISVALYYQAIQMRMVLGATLGPRYNGAMYHYSLDAWQDIRRRADSLSTHPYCPSPVRWAYEKVRDFLIRSVTPPPQAPAPAQ